MRRAHLLISLSVVLLLLCNPKQGEAQEDTRIYLRLFDCEIELGQTGSLGLFIYGPRDRGWPKLSSPAGLDVRVVGSDSGENLFQVFYQATPQKTGEFTIGPVEITNEGIPYSSNIARLIVTESGPAEAKSSEQGCIQGLSPEQARNELIDQGILYTPEVFLENVQQGNISAVCLFLDAGFDPDTRDSDGYTALMLAKKMEIIKSLLSKNADVNARANNGRTALMQAARRRDLRLVEALLAAGADPLAKTDEGATALTEAAKYARTDILELLLDHGADINARDENGRTPLAIVANQIKNLSDVNLLLERGADVNVKDKDGKTPLIIAGKKGNPAVIKALLAHDADVNQRTSKSGFSPLMAVACNSELLELLLAHGADPHAETSSGWTALTTAVQCKNARNVETLLAKGCRVTGKTVYIAAERGDAEIFKMLMAVGGDVNEKNEHGITTLMIAVAGGRLEIVEELLARGADVNARSDEGLSALDAANNLSPVHPVYGSIAQLLKQAGAPCFLLPDNQEKPVLRRTREQGPSKISGSLCITTLDPAKVRVYDSQGNVDMEEEWGDGVIVTIPHSQFNVYVDNVAIVLPVDDYTVRLFPEESKTVPRGVSLFVELTLEGTDVFHRAFKNIPLKMGSSAQFSFARVGNALSNLTLDTDGDGIYDDAEYPSQPMPIITSYPETTVKAGEQYQYTVVALGVALDKPTYSLRVSPPGMKISSRGNFGEIVWTATCGSAHVIVRATGADGEHDEQEFYINVTGCGPGTHNR